MCRTNASTRFDRFARIAVRQGPVVDTERMVHSSAGASGRAHPWWARWWGLLTPSRSWSTRHWIVYGLLVAFALVALVTNSVGARGPWFGALALAVYGPMFATAAVRHRRAARPLRSPALDTTLFAVYFAALVFLAVGLLTSLSLPWCAAIAATTSAALSLVSYARRDTGAGRARHHAGLF